MSLSCRKARGVLILAFESFYNGWFEPALVAASLALGVLASRGDSQQGKISNKLVFSSLFFAGLMHAPLLFQSGPAFQYLASFAQNFALAALAGVLLWTLKVWSAGDAKLFAAFAALVPLSIYREDYLPFFPSFALLANTLVPAAFFFAAYSFWKTDSPEKIEVFTQSMDAGQVTKVALLAFGLSIALQISNSAGLVSFGAQNPAWGLLALPVFFALSGFLKKIPLALLLSSAAALAAASSYFFGSFFPNIAAAALLTAAITSAAFAGLSFFSRLAAFWFNGSVPLSELRPGMQSLENVFFHKGHYVKRQCGWSGEGFEPALKLEKGVLSDGDVQALKKLRSEGKLSFEGISVKQSLAFAPLLFAGVLATFLMRGSITHLLIQILF